MIQVVIEAGYDLYLKETYANYRQRLEDLEQISSFALQFENTEEFLTQLSLLTNLEERDVLFRRHNMDFVNVRTDRPYVSALVAFFRARDGSRFISQCMRKTGIGLSMNVVAAA